MGTLLQYAKCRSRKQQRGLDSGEGEVMTRRIGPTPIGPKAAEPAYNFDFNDEDLSAVHAAQAVSDEDMARLFEGLRAANAQWNSPSRGPQSAAIEALNAVAQFLGANALNVGGKFSRPIDLLLTELRAAPAPDKRNILPPW